MTLLRCPFVRSPYAEAIATGMTRGAWADAWREEREVEA
jgi:hypothetical protein